MKHKTWFRLILKAIGILLIGLALPNLLQQVGSFALHRSAMVQFAPPPQPLLVELPRFAWMATPPLIQAIIGLYLIIGGKWLLNKIIPSNRPYCPECGYDLSKSGNPAACSECGTALPSPADPYKSAETS